MCIYLNFAKRGYIHLSWAGKSGYRPLNVNHMSLFFPEIIILVGHFVK